jgi:hypothetical protein
MTASKNNLLGLRYIVITESTKGQSPIGGTYRLSFRGAITADIIPTSATSLQTALNNLGLYLCVYIFGAFVIV